MRAKRYNPLTEILPGDLISFREDKPVWYLVLEITQIEQKSKLTKMGINNNHAPTFITNMKCLQAKKQEIFDFQMETGGTFELMLQRPG